MRSRGDQMAGDGGVRAGRHATLGVGAARGAVLQGMLGGKEIGRVVRGAVRVVGK